MLPLLSHQPWTGPWSENGRVGYMNRAFAYRSLLTGLSFQPEAKQHWRSHLDSSGIRRTHHFLLNDHVPVDWLGQ